MPPNVMSVPTMGESFTGSTTIIRVEELTLNGPVIGSDAETLTNRVPDG